MKDAISTFEDCQVWEGEGEDQGGQVTALAEQSRRQGQGALSGRGRQG